ncbi:hypothetical protein [Promicromonospora iranensis]|uniref:Uncharacterized protein n=1 Tax=Promicromonospora iranensis TaxID=1105144 RepID=A0ABU2CWE9_9MICO|nr:hypothetical protein [Promicromonospora iranensis]MDR7385650.1 hypothetical protein [Promicromonospora iranensis]
MQGRAADLCRPHKAVLVVALVLGALGTELVAALRMETGSTVPGAGERAPARA